MHDEHDDAIDPGSVDDESVVAGDPSADDDVVGMAMGPSLRGGLMDLSLGKPIDTSARASLTESELRRLGGG